MQEVFAKGAERARHMANAIAWFAGEFQSAEGFRTSFERLTACLANASADVPEGQPWSQVHFVAVGKSGGVAKIAVSMLASVGINARFLHPTEALHGDFGTVRQGDTVVCISNNGRSSEILELIPKLRDRGCHLFAITARPTAPLAQACPDVLLLPPVEEACPLNQAPITSTVTTLSLCQLLVAACMDLRSYEITKYARNHPGGAIGKRIFVKVDDLMLRGGNLPRVLEEDSFQTCVSAMTSYSSSGLLVLRGTQLLGLIAERDLRLAMERWGPEVFSKCAQHFMNANPIVIQEGTLAVDALQVMEKRPRPLNVLPVVDSNRNVVGLLRLHDLVAEGISLT